MSSSSFWKQMKTTDLSPVDKAESEWSVAHDDKENALRELVPKLVELQNKRMRTKQDDINLKTIEIDILEKQTNVDQLWINWVDLKSYVSRNVKDELKRRHNIRLESLSKLKRELFCLTS